MKNYRNRCCEVIALVGELDISTAQHLETVLDRMLVVPDHIVVDVSELTFIDSSGLKLLLRASKLVDGRIALRDASYFLRKVLDISGLTEFFCIEEDQKAAHQRISLEDAS